MNNDYKVALLISSECNLCVNSELTHFINKLKKSFNVTEIMVDSISELVSKTSTISGQSFDSIILISHGNQHYLSFTDGKIYHKTIWNSCNPYNLWNSLTTHKRFATFAENLKLALKKDGNIWLHACSTGKSSDNVAQKLSNLSNRIVYAPNDVLFSGEVGHHYENDELILVLVNEARTRQIRNNDDDVTLYNYGSNDNEFHWVKHTPLTPNSDFKKSAKKRSVKKISKKSLKKSLKRSTKNRSVKKISKKSLKKK
jgi:hypothetical protein